MPAALSKSSKKASTARSNNKSPRQRNYVITCEGVIIVFKTVVPGSLYIITGDGKQKCIEIKVDPASVGQPAVAGADRPRDINVTATIRTLDVGGGPVKEEIEVKVEEWDEAEGEIVPSNETPPPAAPPAHAAESSTQKRSKPSVSTSAKPQKPADPKSSPSTSSSRSSPDLSLAPTILTTPPNAYRPPASMRSRVAANDVVPPAAALPPTKTKSSPKKRDASEMDSSESDDGRKRVRVEEKPLRSQRKTRAS
ncbi:hypothetical protein B0H16DRAFT_1839400 [Mycena metata]|uniref:Uncharacterized protein n=1 Tax=Mycena metata TaxID=1033252 RepID=A0AAD7DTW8_9AGAR|nr:hypothetical protein B0H16DRAFT_1839400 [Mycena metata]